MLRTVLLRPGVFPQHWLTTRINQKELFALYHLLDQFCGAHPDVLRRAQVLMDVDSQAVEGAFKKGRSRNRVLHELLIQLFELQVEYEFMLSLQWVPTIPRRMRLLTRFRDRRAKLSFSFSRLRSGGFGMP